jgi:glycosyltransferase involved in cell wall biosynthesis
VDLTRYNAEGSSDEKDKLVKELSIDRNKKLILFIGRMIPAKGAFVLAEAAKKICTQRKDVCFLFAGGGTSLDALKKIVRDNQLEYHFRLLGWRRDIPRLLKAADIFTLPTYYNEGLPVSILEAMACGKPVVATKHRGCEDAVVDDETGFLVPVKQVNPLVDKIMLLLDNEQLRTQMGRAGRQRIEQYFELGYCTNKIVEALEKAMR